MIEDNRQPSLNIVGLLAGLLTIPVLFGLVSIAIWILCLL